MGKNRACNLRLFGSHNRLARFTVACVIGVVLLSGRLSDLLGARPSLPIGEYVRQFEARYSGVETLQADFTQTYYSWGRTRVESGFVSLARGGKMRWVYQKPEEKLFVSDGRQICFYVPGEKQVTISSARDAGEARVPLDLLLSRLRLSKVFSRVEFAGQALEADRGDDVIRGYPRLLYKRDYRSVLIELTPQFDVRRLVVFYPDNSTMQFAFTRIERNKTLDSSLFVFSPPPGTEVIHR
jgi:outer membrane lipoprotein carrier protein